MLTNSELITTIITDLNNVLKEQAGGQYLNACSIIHGMVQKLVNLRANIDNDVKNRDETIASLKNELRSHGFEVVDVAPEDLEKELKGE